MKRVLVAVDGSENSLRALDFALKLPELCREVQVTALYVGPSCADLFPEPAGCSWIQQKELDKEIEVRAQKVFEKIDGIVNQHGLTMEKAIARGNAAEAICTFARKGEYDLVVVGGRGYGKVENLLVGSVAQKVLQICPCAVTIVK